MPAAAPAAAAPAAAAEDAPAEVCNVVFSCNVIVVFILCTGEAKGKDRLQC